MSAISLTPSIDGWTATVTGVVPPQFGETPEAAVRACVRKMFSVARSISICFDPILHLWRARCEFIKPTQALGQTADEAVARLQERIAQELAFMSARRVASKTRSARRGRARPARSKSS